MSQIELKWSRAVARCAPCILVALSLGLPGGVRAAGIEDTVTGAEGLGRAASYGRVHDFMAVVQNPANLALATSHIGGELRFPWLRACFDRAANPDLMSEYRQTADGSLLEHFGEVCNDAFSLPTGNLGFAMGFKNWGLGLGFFTPAAVGNFKYGDDTIITLQPEPNEPGTITPEDAGYESPNRYLGLERTGLIGFLMAGVGAQPNKYLRLGVSIGAGMVQLHNKNVVSVAGGTFNDQEIVVDFNVTDWLVGRAVGSVVLTPVPGLEFFGVFQYHGDANAKGTLTATANGISGAPKTNCRHPQEESSGTRCSTSDVKLEIPFVPVEMTMGLRYAMLREGAESAPANPLRDEIFDLEVDVVYSKTSNVDEFKLTVFDPEADTQAGRDLPRIQFGNTDGANSVFLISQTTVPKHWRDTWTVRFGGDVNVVPGRLALRTGASYATNAQPAKYMNIDFWPVRKITAHFGMTVGLGEHDLMHLGYAHVFYQSVKVPVGEGGVSEIAALDAQDALPVNEGNYNAVQDIFSIQLQHNF